MLNSNLSTQQLNSQYGLFAGQRGTWNGHPVVVAQAVATTSLVWVRTTDGSKPFVDGGPHSRRSYASAAGWISTGEFEPEPDECTCVLPGQTCPACAATARRIYPLEETF